MSPPTAGVSLFRRFFGLTENYPLYLMVSIACGLSVYTPIRHLSTAADVALDRKSRDCMDDLGASERVLDKASHYEGGILGAVASIKNWPQVWALPKHIDPQEHFHHERWPAPRPFTVPAPAE